MPMRGSHSGPVTRLADYDVGTGLARAWRLARNAAPETLEAFEDAWQAAAAQHRATEAVLSAAAAVSLIDGYYRDYATLATWLTRLDDVASPTAQVAADRLVVLGARALRAMHASQDAGRAWIDDALAWLRAADDPDRALCGASALVVALDTGRHDADATRIEVAAARFEASAGPWFAANWLSTRAQHALYFHRLDQVDAPLRAARALAAQHDLRPVAVVTTLIAARLAIARGDYAGVRAELDAVEPLDETREPMWRAIEQQLRALRELCIGQFDRALHSARRSIAFAESALAPDDESAPMRAVEGYCLAAVGDSEGAARLLRDCAARAAPMQRRQIDAVAALLEGDVLARAGEASARDRLAGGIAGLRRLDYSGFLWPVPDVAARLCGLALSLDIEPDYVRGIVRARSFSPPPQRPRSWPWLCTIDVLGGFAVRVEGQDASSDRSRGKGKPLDLLTALVAMGGRGVSIAELIRLLWPGEGRVGAQAAFDVTLSRLRRLLGTEGLLVIQDRRLGLDPRVVDVDRWALESALEACAHASGASFAAAAKRVVDAYRGPLLPGESAPWVDDERRKLRQRVDAAMARVADEVPRRDAIVLLTRAVAADPALPLAQEALASLTRSQE